MIYFSAVLGMEPGVSSRLSTGSTTELHPQQQKEDVNDYLTGSLPVLRSLAL